MYKVIITDNNTDKSYFFKTQHSTDYTSMWSICGKIVEKEKQYHDIDIPLGEVNLKQYLNAVTISMWNVSLWTEEKDMQETLHCLTGGNLLNLLGRILRIMYSNE